MTTTRFEFSITDNLFPICNNNNYENSGFLCHLHCSYIVEFAYDNYNNNRYEFWTPIFRSIYVPDISTSSYESVRLLVSALFTGIDMPEDEQTLTIIRMLEFFITPRRVCQGMVPMFIDLGLVIVLHDEEAATNWVTLYWMLVGEIKCTVPATEWSIQALEKLRVSNGGECCMVCLEELLLGSEVSCMPCKHRFHDDCIAQWLRTMHVCPICRYAMPCDVTESLLTCA